MNCKVGYHIPSSTEKGKEYYVESIGEDLWVCDCLGFTHRGNCRHINEAIALHHSENNAQIH